MRLNTMFRSMYSTKTLALLAVAAALIALPGLSAAVGTLHAESQNANTLAGSWIVQVTPDPQTGIPPFINLFSAVSDGRVINVDSNGTSALGEWQKTTKGQFAVT